MPDGRSRLEAAKFAAADVLSKLPLDTRVGLRVYGHQAKTADRNCDDTALVAPLDTVERNREPLGAALATVQARGYTPISLSLQRAASDLSAEAGSERIVVLLSDGRETCKSDPCGVALALAAADARLVVHSIGLGVDAAARTQLQCIASAARGTYYDANTRGELIERLGQAVVAKAVQPREQPVASDDRDRARIFAD
jgi:Ca-activated chloride channel family protein